MYKYVYKCAKVNFIFKYLPLKFDIYFEYGSKLFFQQTKITSYFRKQMKMILTIFGDENFQTILPPSIIYVDENHYDKLTKINLY